MPAAVRSAILTLVSVVSLVGCGGRQHSPAAAAARPAVPASSPGDPDFYRNDAYSPRQYSVFHGPNRENIYVPATHPATGPANDRDLLPTDDMTW